MRGSGVWADGAVVAIEAEPRQALESSTGARLLGRVDEPLRLLIIEAVLIRIREGFLKRHVGNFGVRHRISKIELLTGRKADCTCDRQLLFCVVVLDRHEPLLA